MSDSGSNLGGGAQALAFLQEMVIAMNAIAGSVGSLAQVVPVPAASNSPGVAGSLAFDSGFLYVCVAADTWKRVALAAF